MNLGDLGKLLDRYGISLDDTKGVRVVPRQRGNMTSPLFLEVKRYLRDGNGNRFAVRWPDGSRSVAYERMRIPLSALEVEGESRLFDPLKKFDGEYDDGRVCHASDIIEEQRPKRKESV